MRTTSSSKGLTLVELLVVISLLALLATKAVPSFNELIQNSQRTAVISELRQFLALARRHSVMTGQIVTVCPTEPDGKCGRNWNGPVSMFADPGNQRTLLQGTKVNAVLPPPKFGNFIVRSLSRSYFQFRPDGFIYSDLGNITWCPDSGEASLAGQLIISRSGRIRTATDSNGDGVVDDAKGKPVRC